MAEAKTKNGAKVIPFEGEGLLSGVVSWGAELAEKAVVTSFDVVRDLSTELHHRFLATVDYVDSSQQAVAKLVRNLGDRALRMSEQVAETGENVSLSLVRTTRELVQEVTGLASRASETLVKAREERAARAA